MAAGAARRTGESESRRARRLVVSFIMTAVNYEYCFYWARVPRHPARLLRTAAARTAAGRRPDDPQ